MDDKVWIEGRSSTLSSSIYIVEKKDELDIFKRPSPVYNLKWLSFKVCLNLLLRIVGLIEAFVSIPSSAFYVKTYNFVRRITRIQQIPQTLIWIESDRC